MSNYKVSKTLAGVWPPVPKHIEHKVAELEARASAADDIIADLNHQLECIPELRAQVEALMQITSTLADLLDNLNDKYSMLRRHCTPASVAESMEIDLGDIPDDVSIEQRIDQLVDAALEAGGE